MEHKRRNFGEREASASKENIIKYRERVRRQKRRRYFRIIAVLTVIISIVLLVWYSIDHWSYDAYEVISHKVQDTEMSAQYIEFGENILKYGGDEAALINRQDEVLWNVTETMKHPVVETCGASWLMYDQKGTSFSVFNLEGKLGTVQTNLPILKAKVTNQGLVAAVLDDGDTTWINLYNTDGSVIVTSKTQMAATGYPIDISLSSDGLLMAVSYVKIENNKISNNVTFYNFGNTGQNLVDNVVCTYNYGDILVPDVEYLDNLWAVAFCENGFGIYKGQQIPEEQVRVTLEQEIMSVFYEGESIGLIVRSGNSDAPYSMEFYNREGKHKWSVPLKTLFDTVKISQNEILLYNKTNFAVYSMKGICRYQGAIEEGNMHGLFKIARNRYLAVLDSGIATFKLVN